MALIPIDISVARRTLASLSNSAGWISLQTAGITASAGTLTFTGDEAPFVSTAQNKGQPIIIRGAGVAGADYYGVISAVTNPTTATVTPNASTTVSGVECAFAGKINDDRHTIQEIDEIMFESDEMIYNAIAETPGHWAQPDLVVLSSSVSNAAAIPTHVGNIVEVLIQKVTAAAYLPAVRWPCIPDINNWNANTGTAPNNIFGTLAPNAAGSALSGYWEIDSNGYLFYTGQDAKIRLFTYIRSAVALQSPGIYTSKLINVGMARLQLKDGDDPQAASVWGKFAESDMGMIRAGVSQ